MIPQLILDRIAHELITLWEATGRHTPSHLEKPGLSVREAAVRVARRSPAQRRRETPALASTFRKRLLAVDFL